MKKLPLFSWIALLFSGCATAKVDQFAQFANAGQEYTTAMSTLLESTGGTLIDADSYQLIADRAKGPVSAEDFRRHDEKLRKPLQDLRLVQRQTDVLGQYFQGLATAVASAKNAPAQFTNHLKGLAGSVQGLVQAVGGAGLFQSEVSRVENSSQAVETIVDDVGELIVKDIEDHRLKKELEAHKEVIARALRQQQEALGFISQMMEEARGAIDAATYQQDVVQPFLSNAPLPPNWMSTRQAELTSPGIPEAVQNAQSAAASLRLAWSQILSSSFGDQEAQALSASMEMLKASLSMANPNGKVTSTESQTPPPAQPEKDPSPSAVPTTGTSG